MFPGKSGGSQVPKGGQERVGRLQTMPRTWLRVVFALSNAQRSWSIQHRTNPELSRLGNRGPQINLLTGVTWGHRNSWKMEIGGQLLI